MIWTYLKFILIQKRFCMKNNTFSNHIGIHFVKKKK